METQLYFDFSMRETLRIALKKLQPVIDMIGYTVKCCDVNAFSSPDRIIWISYNAFPDYIAHEVGHAILGSSCCEEHGEIEANAIAKVLCLLFDIPFRVSSDRSLTDWIVGKLLDKSCNRDIGVGWWQSWTPELCRMGRKVVVELKKM